MEKPKVLIVDDDLSVCNVIDKYMKIQHWDVFVAHDGVEGLNILRQRKIDLAVVDLIIPEMNGMTLLRKAKQENIQTQIVIMTGYGAVDSAIDAMKIGAVDYIRKPIIAIDFVKKMADYLPTSHSWHDVLLHFLEQRYQDVSFGLKDVLQRFQFSKTTCYELFNEHLDMPFRACLYKLRMKKALQMMAETSLSLTEIAHACGFCNLGQFSKAFKRGFGEFPSKYRKKMNQRANFEPEGKF